MVAHRAEEGDLGTGGFEELEVLGISEVERFVAGHRDHRAIAIDVRIAGETNVSGHLASPGDGA